MTCLNHKYLYRWASLFFYLLTGKIQFAPLKSRGSEHRSKWILESAKPGGLPAPCSPKTIYLLVEKVNQSYSYTSNYFLHNEPTPWIASMEK